jgi:hypothetical protein
VQSSATSELTATLSCQRSPKDARELNRYLQVRELNWRIGWRTEIFAYV